MTVYDLPAVNACFNTLSAIFLIAGWRCIKKGNRIAHRNCMVAALTSSALFLAGYLTYHYTARTTNFVNPAWFRPIYLTLLLTHTVLAVVILPLIFMAVFYAVKGRFESHKKVVRWAWPFWLYVSVTGVIIYLLLYQIFPQAKG